MAFWRTETLRHRLAAEHLIEPYDEANVKHAAYELGLGNEAFATSNSERTKTQVSEVQQFVIPPGQFALLLTSERVSVPKDAIAFISIKAGIKFRGLVNVSGFHVDPGFSGRLKFAVYNAGSQDIVLDHSQRVFLVWFANLDDSTEDVYTGRNLNQLSISGDDIMRIQGDVASPAALKKTVDELRGDYDKRISAVETSVTVWRGITIAFLIAITILVLRGLAEGAEAPEDEAAYLATPRVALEMTLGHGLATDLRDLAP